MKIAVMGDLHGKKIWKVLKERIDEYDKIILMGDYVDSVFRTDSQILNNLQQILLFKESNPNKIILIKGNHENQYHFSENLKFRSSGFRITMSSQLKNIFIVHDRSFHYAYQIKDTLFIHGGLLTGFYNELNKKYPHLDNENYGEYINRIAKRDINAFINKSEFRGGKDDFNSPFWTDWEELSSQKKFLPINQITGHSYKYGGKFKIIGDNFILNTDILDRENAFFEIIIEKETYFKKINI
jgi:predicted phosphodiesterase